MIIISAEYLSRNDKINNWSGFSYHLATYIILIGFAIKGAHAEDYEYLNDELKHLVLSLIVVWVLVLLLHLGFHFLRQWNKKSKKHLNQ